MCIWESLKHAHTLKWKITWISEDVELKIILVLVNNWIL